MDEKDPTFVQDYEEHRFEESRAELVQSTDVLRVRQSKLMKYLVTTTLS